MFKLWLRERKQRGPGISSCSWRRFPSLIWDVTLLMIHRSQQQRSWERRGTRQDDRDINTLRVHNMSESIERERFTSPPLHMFYSRAASRGHKTTAGEWRPVDSDSDWHCVVVFSEKWLIKKGAEKNKIKFYSFTLRINERHKIKKHIKKSTLL